LVDEGNQLVKPAWAEWGHLRRAGIVAAGVGTALVLLNQGDLLVAWYSGGKLAPALLWKIPLTYAVPFLVSWGSSLAAVRKRRGSSGDVLEQ
jgi:hypothetical protein